MKKYKFYKRLFLFQTIIGVFNVFFIVHITEEYFHLFYPSLLASIFFPSIFLPEKNDTCLMEIFFLEKKKEENFKTFLSEEKTIYLKESFLIRAEKAKNINLFIILCFLFTYDFFVYIKELNLQPLFAFYGLSFKLSLLIFFASSVLFTMFSCLFSIKNRYNIHIANKADCKNKNRLKEKIKNNINKNKIINFINKNPKNYFTYLDLFIINEYIKTENNKNNSNLYI